MFTNEGESDSSVASILLAGVPQTPTDAPRKTSSESTSTTITVEYDAVDAANNGGSAVLGYSLEMDDGSGGDYVTLVGTSSDYLKLKFSVSSAQVSKGGTYRFRYRAKNVYGWSDYSPVAYLLVASVPS